MINDLTGILFSLFMGIMFLLVNKANGNPYNLTKRGLRVVFVLTIIAGLLIHQVILHLYWTGDGYKWI